MSALEQLAADLAHAAGAGVEHLRAELLHGALTQTEVGFATPGVSRLADAAQTVPFSGAEKTTAQTGAPVEATAQHMAERAAEGGARLVAGGSP